MLSNKWYLKKPKFFKPIYSLHLPEVTVFNGWRPTSVHIKSLKMPNSTKSYKCDQHNVEIVDNNPVEDVTSEKESTSSDQEVFFTPNHPQV